MRCLPAGCLMLFAVPLLLAAEPPAWTKVVIDRKFQSEGVAVADVNHDGKLDILVGDLWYEAPDWKPHPIRPAKDHGDGSKGYSESFACWAEDIDGDGWADLIVIGFPGKPCHWYENPRNQGGMWKEHVIWHSACNETPIYADLFGTGKRALVMGWQPKGEEKLGQLAWFRPGSDCRQPWEMHPVSGPSEKGKEVPGTYKYYHGLGVGDLNGDGRADVITRHGWFEQPASKDKADGPWTFHPATLGEDCADMVAYDVNGDGVPDVISSSAHREGIWAHVGKREGDKLTYSKTDLFKNLFSQSHALVVADIDRDGRPDFVTGKRFWAHGPKGDVNPDAPVVLYWFKAVPAPGGGTAFEPHKIDDDSGVGTQFQVIDLNGDGKLDIVTASKRGVYVHLQK